MQIQKTFAYPLFTSLLVIIYFWMVVSLKFYNIFYVLNDSDVLKIILIFQCQKEQI